MEGPGEIREITYNRRSDENKAGYLTAIDPIIRAWQPYFRALPTKKFYVHFDPKMEWRDDLVSVREEWKPDCLRPDVSDPKAKYLQAERQT